MEQFEFYYNLSDARYEGISRVDLFLAEQLEKLSRSLVKKLINDGAVLVNSKTVKPGHRLKNGDTVLITVPELDDTPIAAENIPLDVLYEDLDLIVVNKPQGMVVHPAAGHFSGTLVNALMFRCADNLSGINGAKRPGIVHRIDKDTSGVLVVAKNDSSHNALSEQLASHSMTRLYLAVAHGNVKNDSGTIDKPIGRHPMDRIKMAVTIKNGRSAVTHYKVLERFGSHTFVEARLETGRTHQIRVHMSSIGHPLVGDPVYGGLSNQYKLSGQALHAKKLGFTHPSTGKYMCFEAELPDYFINLLKKLRLKA